MKIEDIKIYLDMFKLGFMSVYATLVTAASFYFFFQIVFGKIPEDNQQYANLILGFLIGSGIPTFLGYYYGMSQSTGRASEKMPPPTEFTQTTTRTESTTTDLPKE
jgi:hypothetical protein